ncbi:MAG: AAA family ATPase [Candidatus Diapherotrites archaeon]|nr:AAA family ATPase [Candidatus Diapherotrites archaeon]
MKLLITGSPGTGKTTIAKQLAKRLRCKMINEADFALQKGIAKWDHSNAELEIPLRKLKQELSKVLGKNNNIIIEGHTLCEIKLDVDAVVLLRVHPEILQERLERKGYNDMKIMDNVFCEGIDYCKKHVFRRYKKNKIIEVKNEKGIRETLNTIIKELKERGMYG